MKGSLSLPVETLIFIILGLAFLGIAFIFLKPAGNVGEDQTAKTVLESCCLSYVMSGKCPEYFDDFECSVPESFSKSKKMKISDLAARSSLDYVEVCCR